MSNSLAPKLVAELIGNEPFEEEILETTLDARRRLLKPGARLIPHSLELVAHPLRLPEEVARQRAIGEQAVERWRQLYGIEFQPLLDAAFPAPVNNPTEPEYLAGWTPVGPPVSIARVDLGTFARPTVDASAELGLTRATSVNAIAVTFRAHLHERIVHALDPWRWSSSSWAASVWVLPDALPVGRHDTLRVRYTRRAPGRADGLTCAVSPVLGDAQPDWHGHDDGENPAAHADRETGQDCFAVAAPRDVQEFANRRAARQQPPDEKENEEDGMQTKQLVERDARQLLRGRNPQR